jgi:16S rRNA (cytosine1407-C5)-methyltransferase
VEFLISTQCHLLRFAVTMMKPGGVIVDSTCPLSPEENEHVIDWILQKEPDGVQVEPIELPLENILPGMTQWEQQRFSDQVRRAIRVLPSELMEGFFLAKLRKR